MILESSKAKTPRPQRPHSLIASPEDLTNALRMKLFVTIFAAYALVISAKEPTKEPRAATDFIRVDRSEENVLLQPALATYEKNGVKVSLIGAVHIADKAYFNDLNKRFKSYDRVLFEMIGGDQLEKLRKQEAEGKKAEESPLGQVYKMVSGFLALADQKTEIDYTAENFVHADLTMEEYQTLQEERGESLLGFAMEAAKNTDMKTQPSTMALMQAVMVGDSKKAKLLLVDALAGGDEAMGGLVAPTVVISDRNEKALKVLDAQIAKGDKNLGIFYGAAHFPAMEKTLLEKGYRKTKQEWLTAWTVEK